MARNEKINLHVEIALFSHISSRYVLKSPPSNIFIIEKNDFINFSAINCICHPKVVKSPPLSIFLFMLHIFFKHFLNYSHRMIYSRIFILLSHIHIEDFNANLQKEIKMQIFLSLSLFP